MEEKDDVRGGRPGRREGYEGKTLTTEPLTTQFEVDFMKGVFFQDVVLTDPSLPGAVKESEIRGTPFTYLLPYTGPKFRNCRLRPTTMSNSRSGGETLRRK